jgi:hypothetical protein
MADDFEIECVWNALPGEPPPQIKCFHIHEDGSKHECSVVNLQDGKGMEYGCACGAKGKVIFRTKKE